MGVDFEPCDMCGEAGKYTCPRCSTRSCSLPCVKQHKKLSGCDGIRQKLKYIPLNKFTELDMVQDFRILEEVTSQVDKCKRDKLKRSTRQSVDGYCAPKIASSLRKLQAEAIKFGTKVKILPPHFVRRKNNTSHFDFKTKSIHWDVEINLPDLDKSFQLKRIPDKTKLWRVFAEIFEANVLGDSVSLPLQDWSTEEFDVYRSVGYGGVLVYLRCESSYKENKSDESQTQNSRHFFQLDFKRSLRSNLRDKVVVEHPVIHLVMKGEECNYRSEADIFSAELERLEVEDRGKGMEEDRLDGPQPPLDVGSAWGEEENMAADPEAYKQYYDFYLKYYTQKYAKQGIPNQNQSQRLPSAFQMLGNFKQPPPYQTSCQGSNQPKKQANPPADIHRPPSETCFPPSKSSPNLASINKANVENARKIQSEIRQDNQHLGLLGLVAYDDSDSD